MIRNHEKISGAVYIWDGLAGDCNCPRQGMAKAEHRAVIPRAILFLDMRSTSTPSLSLPFQRKEIYTPFSRHSLRYFFYYIDSPKNDLGHVNCYWREMHDRRRHHSGSLITLGASHGWARDVRMSTEEEWHSQAAVERVKAN